MSSVERQRRVDALALGLQDAPRLEPGGDIRLDRRPGKQGRVLEDENPRRIGTRDRRAVGENRAARRRFEPGDQPEQRRFPAAGRSEQRDELAGGDIEVDRREDRQPRAAEVELVADAANVERKAGIVAELARRRRDGDSDAHEMNPFCQLSRRSRAENSSRTTPEHNSAMINSVA